MIKLCLKSRELYDAKTNTRSRSTINQDTALGSVSWDSEKKFGFQISG